MRRNFTRSAILLIGFGLMCNAAARTAAGEGDTYEYEGVNGCKKCHLSTYKSWEDLAHGKAMDTLKPGEKAEAKKAAGLDPEKDYTTDAKCLKCHTTGYGTESGYKVPDPNDRREVRKMERLANVTCEACHGPGSAYADLFKEIMKANRKYELQELTAVGLVIPTEQTCVKCHNEESPTHKPFNFEEAKKKGVHEHEELKLRKE